MCRYPFTNEQIDFLEVQGPFMTVPELTKKFNETYCQNRSRFVIRKACLTRNIKIKRTRRRDLAVGSERIDSRGYIAVKTTAQHTHGGTVWRRKHIVIWESAHGPVPKGFNVIFADGNNCNFALDNLVKISRAEAGIISCLKLWSSDAELTKIAVNIAKLRVKMRGREKQ